MLTSLQLWTSERCRALLLYVRQKVDQPGYRGGLPHHHPQPCSPNRISDPGQPDRTGERSPSPKLTNHASCFSPQCSAILNVAEHAILDQSQPNGGLALSWANLLRRSLTESLRSEPLGTSEENNHNLPSGNEKGNMDFP